MSITAEQALGSAKKYTRDSLAGAGALKGDPGDSAYQVAVNNGFVGTEQEWLDSLKGTNGTNGKDGKDGKDGRDGIDGTNGTNGTNGKSAYELAVDEGYTGTEEEWLASLHGADGTNGTDGVDGFSPTIAVKTSTSESYVLTITDKNGSYDTPNLKGSGGGGGSSSMSDLTDVSFSGLADGDYLGYDGTASKWKNKKFPTIPTKTSDLTNDSNFVQDANYVHITVDSNITQSGTNPVQGGVIYSALGDKVNTSSVGAASGVASLDSSGKLPTSQLNGTVPTSISVNGVSQTVSNNGVDLNIEDNLITETQWTAIQALLA